MLAAISAAAEDYWNRIREWAKTFPSDGCTAVADIYVDCCFEHDYHYTYGHTLKGDALTKWEADKRFRLCIQSNSPFGKFSLLSWWRWLAVTLFGRGIWNKHA